MDWRDEREKLPSWKLVDKTPESCASRAVRRSVALNQETWHGILSNLIWLTLSPECGSSVNDAFSGIRTFFRKMDGW